MKLRKIKLLSSSVTAAIITIPKQGFIICKADIIPPDLMRFISQDDPVLSNAQGEPIGSNLYVYCLNNPVMNSDLSGHWVFGIGIASSFYVPTGGVVAVS